MVSSVRGFLIGRARPPAPAVGVGVIHEGFPGGGDIFRDGQVPPQGVIPFPIRAANDVAIEVIIFEKIDFFAHLDISHFLTPVVRDDQRQRDDLRVVRGNATSFFTSFFQVVNCSFFDFHINNQGASGSRSGFSFSAGHDGTGK